MKKMMKITVIFILLLALSSNINAKVDISPDPFLNKEDPDYPLNDGTNSRQRSASRSLGTYEINNLEDFIYFANSSKSIIDSTIILNVDIDLKSTKLSAPIRINKGVTFDGNNHYIKNYTHNDQLISTNEGTIRKIKFNNINITKDTYANIIAKNFDLIENITVINSSFSAATSYSGTVGRNYGTIDGANLTNITTITGSYGGSLVGLNTTDPSSYDVNKVEESRYPIVKNSSFNNMKIRSIAYAKKKTYRNNNLNDSIQGDMLGGVVGKNVNGRIIAMNAKTVSMYGDDYLGGIVGVNYTTNNKRNFLTTVENSVITNTIIYAGNRAAAIVGHHSTDQSISTSRINYKKNYHNSILTIARNVHVRGSLTVNGYGEVAGLAGLNYKSKIANSTVAVKRKNYNVYSYYDEAAGFVADNEFGYVADSSTNANSYAKVYQAAGFVADNEGTLIRCKATGNSKTRKEAGGFVASNLGTVVSSKAYGRVYTSTKVKRYIKVKKKCKSTKKKKCKKKYVYKKVKRYYPVHSGNFAGYNGKEKYKNFNLKGKTYSSKYYGKRYLNNKRVSNRHVGAYGR